LSRFQAQDEEELKQDGNRSIAAPFFQKMKRISTDARPLCDLGRRKPPTQPVETQVFFQTVENPLKSNS
jgi:hypothetical protein